MRRKEVIGLKRNLHAGKRMSGGFSINVFTDDELYEIHLATLEVLQKTGLFVEDEEALEIFGGHGATIDKQRKIAKFPPYLVEDANRSAPEKITLCGRNPKNDVVLESNRVCFTNFGEAIYVDDPYTGEHRVTTKQDVADSALLADYLDNIDVYERAVGAVDKPPQTLNIHNAHAILMNTTKHCFLGGGDRPSMAKIVEMAEAILEGKDRLKEHPIFSINVCPTSPLRLTLEYCQVAIDTMRVGVPLNIISMAMSGGSTPVTLAGTLVVHNAEVLGTVTLSQLVRKGTPVIYGSSTTSMDLRMGTASVGCPELGMISAAIAKLGQFYQLPTWVAGG
jgi:trimethylamine--corrinoid protein Co-methyltransferase